MASCTPASPSIDLATVSLNTYAFPPRPLHLPIANLSNSPPNSHIGRSVLGSSITKLEVQLLIFCMGAYNLTI